MGFDLILTFLFAVIMFLIIYQGHSKVTVIEPESSKTESFAITGDQDDYMLGGIDVRADIFNPDGSNLYTEYNSCEDYTKMKTGVAPNDILRAVTGHSYRDNVIYDDYALTSDEAAAVSNLMVARTKGPRGQSLISFEHDNSSL